MDLYNYANANSGVDYSALDMMSNDSIIKAMEAGGLTGMQYNNMLNNGGGLKLESLDATLKVLAPRLSQAVFLNEMPKQKIFQNVHQYNQLVKYAEEIGYFNNEGETPQESDSVYRRKSIVTKYLGITGQVTDPAILARLAGGVNMYTKEVENKTIQMHLGIDGLLTGADSTCVDLEFDGVFRQHMTGVAEAEAGSIEGMTPEVLMDTYFSSAAIVDADGGILTDALVEDAADRVVNVYNGEISQIISHPVVFNNYVKKFHESKRVIVGMRDSVTGATMGQSVNDITTQFGKVAVKNDKFFDMRTPKKVGSLATSPKAPATPVIGTPATAAVDADVKTKFTNHPGTYGYLVTAKNRYGESAPLNLSTGGLQAVTATQSVDLKFTAGTGSAYQPSCYVIYRTKMVASVNSMTEYYPIITVPVTGMTSGWDGAAAGLVRDRNRIQAGTKSVLIYYNDSQIMEYLQFRDISKIDYAITAPSRRFSILNYASPVLYAPAKICRIINVGSDNLTV